MDGGLVGKKWLAGTGMPSFQPQLSIWKGEIVEIRRRHRQISINQQGHAPCAGY